MEEKEETSEETTEESIAKSTEEPTEETGKDNTSEVKPDPFASLDARLTQIEDAIAKLNLAIDLFVDNGATITETAEPGANDIEAEIVPEFLSSDLNELNFLDEVKED